MGSKISLVDGSCWYEGVDFVETTINIFTSLLLSFQECDVRAFYKTTIIPHLPIVCLHLKISNVMPN